MGKDEIQELFGVDEKSVTEMREFPLKLDTSFLDDLKQHLDIKFVEDSPREIEFKNSDGENEKGKVINVEWENDVYTLWLSAKSLAMGVAKLYKDNNGLLDVHARLKKTKGTHEKFGEVLYYRVTKLRNVEV